MIKVSVVIPVYNVKAYLRQCLDSVVQQTLKEIEIICVDDGSTDGSSEILEQYAREDTRVTVLRQQNQYAGVARNAGLEIAVGEYIIFWDSDDYFCLDALEKMYTRAKSFQADICVCDAQDFDAESGGMISHLYLHKPFPKEEVFNIQTYKSYIYTFTAPVPWNKLIRRKLLVDEGIRFQEIKHINDVLGTFTALSCAKRIVLLPEKLIFYRANRRDSLMSTYGNKGDSVFLAYEQLKRDLERRGFLSDEEILRSFRNKVLGIYIFTMKYCNTFEQYTAYYRDMVDHRFLYMGLEDLPEGYIFNQANEEKYQRIRELSPEEYVFWQFQKLNLNNTILKERLVKEKDRIGRQKKKIAANRERIRRQKKKIHECHAVIARQKELLQLKTVKMAIRFSKWLGKWRLGKRR